jgi:hypothetical protein
MIDILLDEDTVELSKVTHGFIPLSSLVNQMITLPLSGAPLR